MNSDKRNLVWQALFTGLSMKLISATLACYLFFAGFCSVTDLQAQNPAAIPCRVKVRMIQGMSQGENLAQDVSQTKPVTRDSKPGFRASAGREGDDAILPEMESQLKTLPFADFKVLDSSERELEFEEEGVFVVADADAQLHRVAITPSSADDRRVKMIVRWQGPDGKQLLASELKVANGKCLVLGTDSTRPDQSTILSIRARCAAGRAD